MMTKVILEKMIDIFYIIKHKIDLKMETMTLSIWYFAITNLTIDTKIQLKHSNRRHANFVIWVAAILNLPKNEALRCHKIWTP